jgi:hypothetical protein
VAVCQSRFEDWPISDTETPVLTDGEVPTTGDTDLLKYWELTH